MTLGSNLRLLTYMSFLTAAVAITCIVKEARSDALFVYFSLDFDSLAIRDFGKEPRESETLANQHRNRSDHNQQRYG